MNEFGELLIAGKLGRLWVIIALVSSLFGTISYLLAYKNRNNPLHSSWQKLGAIGFFIQGGSFLAIIATIYYLIFNYHFEYNYVFSHASRDLPFNYLFSCFWEGQEGSTLLWAFWHTVLGVILYFTAGKWRITVMAAFCFVQAWLASLLLGFHFGDLAIGTSPFELLKDVNANAPIFQFPNYLEMISDGNGLNPLLQNYWMVIHPPTLFLGFASTLIPFAYTIAALINKDFKGYAKAVLPWTLFSGAILGTGILMGGAWAYEALTFGGFWAWDPVENSSLVPWVVLLAGLHTLLAFRNTGYSLKITLFLLSFPFVMVLYSTFLTKSGILGDASVHAFTESGLLTQLFIFISVFTLLIVTLIAINWKKLPRKKKEEKTSSKEFWMFIGSLILMFSAIQITFETSKPVYNKVFAIINGWTNSTALPDNMALREPQFYTSIQTWIMVVMLILVASIQYFRYRDTPIKKVLKQLGIPVVASVIMAGLLGKIFELDFLMAYGENFKFISPYALLLFMTVFTILANLSYIINIIKGKIFLSGASIAHIGFALLLLGAMISTHKREVLRSNAEHMISDTGVDKQNVGLNVLLFRNTPVQMSDYTVTYVGDSVAMPNIYYKIDYQKFDDQTNEEIESFSLWPSAQHNPTMGLVSSPGTKRYLDKDIYTHITRAPDKSKPEEVDSGDVKTYLLARADTFKGEIFHGVFNGINPVPVSDNYKSQKGDLAFGVKLKLFANNLQFEVEPIYYIRNDVGFSTTEQVTQLGQKFKITRVLPEQQLIEIQTERYTPDYVTMKAIVFPYINVLWAGCFIMVLGFLIAIVNRVKQKKDSKN